MAGPGVPSTSKTFLLWSITNFLPSATKLPKSNERRHKGNAKKVVPTRTNGEYSERIKVVPSDEKIVSKNANPSKWLHAITCCHKHRLRPAGDLGTATNHIYRYRYCEAFLENLIFWNLPWISIILKIPLRGQSINHMKTFKSVLFK